jgi:hypothetical protein
VTKRGVSRKLNIEAFGMGRWLAPSVRLLCAAAILTLVACASSAAPTGPGKQMGPSVDLAGFVTTDQAVAPSDMSTATDFSSHSDLSAPRDLTAPADLAAQPCGSITVFGTCIGSTFVSCDPDTNTLDTESCTACIVFEGIATCF